MFCRLLTLIALVLLQHSLKRWAVVLFIITFNQTGKAQIRLTLAEAIRMGIVYNSELQTAIGKEAITVSNRHIGVPEQWPVVDLAVSQTNNMNQYNSPTSFVRGFYQDNTLTGGLTGSWLIYNGGRVGISRTILDQLAQQATLNTQATRQQVIHTIVSAYYRAVVDTEKLWVRAEAVRLSKARWQDMLMQTQMGKSAQFDVVQAENLFLTDSMTYIQQEIALENASNTLHKAIGWGRFEPVVLVDSLSTPIESALFTNLAGKLLRQNFTLQRQRVSTQLVDSDIRLQKTALFPVVKLNSSINQSLTGTKFPDYPRTSGNSTNFMLMGVSLSLPLLSSRTAKQQIRQRELERIVTERETKGLERQLLADAELRNHSYRLQSKVIALSVLITKGAARSLDIARNRLQNGFSTLLEYRTVQLAYTEARMNHIQALYNLKLIETDAGQLISNLR